MESSLMQGKHIIVSPCFFGTLYISQLIYILLDGVVCFVLHKCSFARHLNYTIAVVLGVGPGHIHNVERILLCRAS